MNLQYITKLKIKIDNPALHSTVSFFHSMNIYTTKISNVPVFIQSVLEFKKHIEQSSLPLDITKTVTSSTIPLEINQTQTLILPSQNLRKMKQTLLYID